MLGFRYMSSNSYPALFQPIHTFRIQHGGSHLSTKLDLHDHDRLTLLRLHDIIFTGYNRQGKNWRIKRSEEAHVNVLLYVACRQNYAAY